MSCGGPPCCPPCGPCGAPACCPPIVIKQTIERCGQTCVFQLPPVNIVCEIPPAPRSPQPPKMCCIPIVCCEEEVCCQNPPYPPPTCCPPRGGCC